MKSWMAIFNPETWTTLLEMTPKVCAFNDLPSRAFPAIAVGDRFICYVSGAQVWAGILSVAGAKYRSQDRLYAGGTFPNRIPVECEIAYHNLDEAVKMSELEGLLSFFPVGGTGKNWAPHVRISPRIMHVPDADAIASSLMKQLSLKSKAA
jgi:hypothetical protein